MHARTPRPLRLAAGWLAATVAFVGLFAGALVGAAGGAGLVDLVRTTTTTSSALPSFEDVLAGLVNGPSPSTTTSTTTPPPPTTTTTTAPPQQASTTTVAPDHVNRGGSTEVASQGTSVTVPTRTVPTLPPQVNGVAAPVTGLDVTPVPADAGAGTKPAVPPRSVVLLDEHVWMPPLDGSRRSTTSIFDRLAGLDLTPEVIAQIMSPFPVAGPAAYRDDWGAPRLTPLLRAHEGTDVFAAPGTPVIASTDGVVGWFTEDSGVSGTSLRLTAANGSYFSYAHLDRLAPSLSEGDRVERGDVLGFVGATGNAATTDPHLYFEIHPGGGAAVNPVPYLDRWLAEAELAAEAVEAAPGDAATALALRTRTAVRGVRPAAGAAPAVPDGTIQLGELQPISATAAGPAGFLALLSGGWFAWHRAARRRRRRALRRAQG